MVLLIRFYIKIRKINSFNFETCFLMSDFEREEQKTSYEPLSTSSTSKEFIYIRRSCIRISRDSKGVLNSKQNSGKWLPKEQRKAAKQCKYSEYKPVF